MANTKDQAELKKLITKLTPIVPQSQPQQWLPRSDLAAAVAEIINAVDAAVHRGDYYANETKSQSRKINELVNEKQQLLQRKPAVSQDAVYTARENQGLQRRIGALMCEVRDLKAENAKITALMSEVRDLKAESAALNVENTTWKTFYAQLLPGEFTLHANPCCTCQRSDTAQAACIMHSLPKRTLGSWTRAGSSRLPQ